MPKQKLTYEFVKSEFEKRKYILLDTEYINSKTKMKYICDNNHINYITYNSFSQGKGCLECSGRKKHTYEFVKSEFEKRNFELLEAEYINARTKMKYKCLKCNSINSIKYDHLKNNCGCATCHHIKIADNKRLSYEFIKLEFEKRGYTLLEPEYVNNYTKMKYKCDKNHEGYTSYGNLYNGVGCKKCSIEKMKGSNNPSWNPNRHQIEMNKKIRSLCGHLLRRSLKSLNMKKSDRTYKLLGYHPKQLLEHLESFPNWNEIKEQKWHLDHIIPVKAFVENEIEDLKIINHLSNLQPLTVEENLKKRDVYLQEDFDNYIKKFNIK